MRVRIIIDSIEPDELPLVLAAHRNAIKYGPEVPRSIEAEDHAKFNFAMDVCNMGSGFDARSIAFTPVHGLSMLDAIVDGLAG